MHAAELLALQDGDGFLDRSDVVELLISMEMNPTPDLVDAMIAKGDRDGDGRISLIEYAALVLL